MQWGKCIRIFPSCLSKLGRHNRQGTQSNTFLWKEYVKFVFIKWFQDSQGLENIQNRSPDGQHLYKYFCFDTITPGMHLKVKEHYCFFILFEKKFLLGARFPQIVFFTDNIPNNQSFYDVSSMNIWKWIGEKANNFTFRDILFIVFIFNNLFWTVLNIKSNLIFHLFVSIKCHHAS